MPDIKIDNQSNGNNQSVKRPNANFRLRTPIKQSGDVTKATEEQQKQNNMIAEYDKMSNDNQINLLKQQNQTISKISNTALASSSQMLGKIQDMSNTLKGASQQIKQRTDSNLTQQQQKQQQQQQKQQQQQQ